jgi:hypothetical protein
MSALLTVICAYCRQPFAANAWERRIGLGTHCSYRCALADEAKARLSA